MACFDAFMTALKSPRQVGCIFCVYCFVFIQKVTKTEKLMSMKKSEIQP